MPFRRWVVTALNERRIVSCSDRSALRQRTISFSGAYVARRDHQTNPFAGTGPRGILDPHPDTGAFSYLKSQYGCRDRGGTSHLRQLTFPFAFEARSRVPDGGEKSGGKGGGNL